MTDRAFLESANTESAIVVARGPGQDWEGGGTWGWLTKGIMRDPSGDENLLPLECINVNILVVIL